VGGSRLDQASIKKPILLSLGSALALLLGGVIVGAYLLEREAVRTEVAQRIAEVENLCTTHIEEDYKMMETAIIAVSQDHRFRESVKSTDREKLLASATPLYRRLRDSVHITHMYFNGPDRVNILRMHDPPRYGDLIDRFTMREAERTGELAYGVELGPLGTLTTRAVHPCHEGDTRIGYLELGHEMNHVIDILRRTLNVEVCILVRKKYLDREGWEAGMRLMDRVPDWDRLPDSVSTGRIPALMGEDLLRLMTNSDGEPPEGLHETTAGDRAGRLAFLPLLDAAQREVGCLAVRLDVHDRLESSVRFVLAVALGCMTAGAALIAAFYLLVHRIEMRLRRAA
jgi:hypothetical protein